MKFVIQNVLNASVTIDEQIVGKINQGYVVFIGVSDEDDVAIADKMIQKMINLRIFKDENGKTHICGVCKGKVRNSVGAGDSMVAGFIAGCENGDYEYALKLGTASGGATAFSDGLAEKKTIDELMEQLA